MPKLRDLLSYDAKDLAAMSDAQLRDLLQPNIDRIARVIAAEKAKSKEVNLNKQLHNIGARPSPGIPKPKKKVESAAARMKHTLDKINRELEEARILQENKEAGV